MICSNFPFPNYKASQQGSWSPNSKEKARIKVFVRCRPPKPEEFPYASCLTLEQNAVKVKKSSYHIKEFKFDRVFNAKESQETVYNTVAKSALDDIFKGYHSTIFAYGQTGSGKTHTMSSQITGDEGIILRAITEIFKGIKEDVENEYAVKMSYVQIYMEMSIYSHSKNYIQDLLNPENKQLQIREDPDNGIYISGVHHQLINDSNEAIYYYSKGDENRITALTNMNATSSRSHACLIINIEKRVRINIGQAVDEEYEKKKLTRANLFLVDLAGSERVKKTEATGIRKTEANYINLSLTTLGIVINALESSLSHVPFRDSKLTRLLQDSLSGNGKTRIIITIGPSILDVQETISSLQFGQRAMNVQTSAKINMTVDYKVISIKLQQQLEDLEKKYLNLQKDLQETLSENYRLEKELISKNREIEYLSERSKGSLRSIEQEKDELFESVEKEKEENKNQKQTILEQSLLIEELRRKNDEILRKFDERMSQQQSYQNIIDSLQQQIEKKDLEINHLITELKRLNKKEESISIINKELEYNNEQLKEQIFKNEQQYSIEKEDLQNSISILVASNENLTKELHIIWNKCEEQIHNLQLSVNMKEDMDQEMESLRAQNRQLIKCEQELINKERLVQKQQQEISSLENQNRLLKESNITQTIEIEQLKSTLSNVNSKKDQVIIGLEEANVKVSEAKLRIFSLEEEYKKSCNNITILNQTIQKLSNSIAIYQNKLFDFNRSISSLSKSIPISSEKESSQEFQNSGKKILSKHPLEEEDRNNLESFMHNFAQNIEGLKKKIKLQQIHIEELQKQKELYQSISEKNSTTLIYFTDRLQSIIDLYCVVKNVSNEVLEFGKILHSMLNNFGNEDLSKKVLLLVRQKFKHKTGDSFDQFAEDTGTDINQISEQWKQQMEEIIKYSVTRPTEELHTYSNTTVKQLILSTVQNQEIPDLPKYVPLDAFAENKNLFINGNNTSLIEDLDDTVLDFIEEKAYMNAHDRLVVKKETFKNIRLEYSCATEERISKLLDTLEKSFTHNQDIIIVSDCWLNVSWIILSILSKKIEQDEYSQRELLSLANDLAINLLHVIKNSKRLNYALYECALELSKHKESFEDFKNKMKQSQIRSEAATTIQKAYRNYMKKKAQEAALKLENEHRQAMKKIEELCRSKAALTHQLEQYNAETGQLLIRYSYNELENVFSILRSYFLFDIPMKDSHISATSSTPTNTSKRTSLGSVSNSSISPPFDEGKKRNSSDSLSELYGGVKSTRFYMDSIVDVNDFNFARNKTPPALAKYSSLPSSLFDVVNNNPSRTMSPKRRPKSNSQN